VRAVMMTNLVKSTQDCNEVSNNGQLPEQLLTPAVSLLSILRAPRQSDLTRKQKLAMNPPYINIHLLE